jgi:3-hydroxyisobutyrate dehydrogenase-like beta-hydroxyacid dehydrogenase
MNIALLGLGRMGQAIGNRLVADHRLTVWNRSEGRATGLASAGATVATSPAEAIAGADVVVTSLADDDAVRDLALGRNGIRAGIGGGTFVDASTISPELSGELGHLFERFVALPISGAPEAVREGRAMYLAGGRKEVLDGLTPMLVSLDGRVKRFERPELASVAKVTVNLLLLSGIATLAEAASIGRAGGLSSEQLGDLFSDSPMVAPGLQNRLYGVLDGSGPVRWTNALGAKDAGLAEDTAQTDLKMTAAVRAYYQAAVEAGLGDEDIVTVARLLH